MEACNDNPHHKLCDEVRELQETIKALENKLAEAQEAQADLKQNKERLEKDLKVKKNSLSIDQQKCMTNRCAPLY